jgi:type IV secretory pathway VirB3-like protein
MNIIMAMILGLVLLFALFFIGWIFILVVILVITNPWILIFLILLFIFLYAIGEENGK